jgi:hypothetical protein
MDILDRLFAARLIFAGDRQAARVYAGLRRDVARNAATLSRIESRWAAAGISTGTRTLIDMLCEGQAPAGIEHHLRGSPTGRSRADIGHIQHALGTIAECLRIAEPA